MNHYERVCAYVDLDAILFNLENMKKNIDEDTQIVAVIKTDGYGHGAVQIAKQLEKVDYIWGYATATAEEAFILRHEGMNKPILVLGYTFPYAYEEMIRNQIRPALFRLDQAEEFANAAQRLQMSAPVHIKVDTAMSRIGIAPDEQGLSFINQVKKFSELSIEGIFTHFARADEMDKTAVNKQLATYKAFLDQVKTECQIHIPIKHCSNSAGIVEIREANMNLVRAGITLYGLWPSNEVRKDIVPLKAALSLKSHIVYIKTIQKGTCVSYGGTYEASEERLVATIPVGYGDGYPRGLSSEGEVLIRGQRAKILGRVCMDQFMVDITDISDVQMGDEVTLIGTDGDDCITMEELGDISGRFNYELACDLSKRVPRVYMKNGEIVDTKDYYQDYR